MSNYPAGVTDSDPFFDDDPDGVSESCEFCGGSGTVYASREMALDAGDPQLEGQPVNCWFCAAKGANHER